MNKPKLLPPKESNWTVKSCLATNRGTVEVVLEMLEPVPHEACRLLQMAIASAKVKVEEVK